MAPEPLPVPLRQPVEPVEVVEDPLLTPEDPTAAELPDPPLLILAGAGLELPALTPVLCG